MSHLRHNFSKYAAFQDDISHLPDELLLDIVQSRTLQYFIDYAHPHAGLIRERSNASSAYDTRHTVTTGGTGFGMMAFIVGAERGWISNHDAVMRIEKMVDFLGSAETHHGVFSHFLDGRNGKTIPFSEMDDGGDLVETSFLMMGLICAREYFGHDRADFSQKINSLIEAVEWDRHIRQADGALLWHWSPNHGHGMAHPLKGWNECLVTYVLAAAAKTHGVPPAVYHDTWARGEEFINGDRYYGSELPLGPDEGGPLFLSHYSFLGLDPNDLRDRYADYGIQTRMHALINYMHCKDNPFKFAGYSDECWGLTASDSTPYNGRGTYRAHSPTNDYGVISPTAALSSFPYTPVESMRALRHFYEDRGDRLWRAHGFVDAFHPASGWVSNSHLAIDQGPIVIMIENYRSGLLWRLAMNAPEVKAGLTALGFTSPHLTNQNSTAPSYSVG